MWPSTTAAYTPPTGPAGVGSGGATVGELDGTTEGGLLPWPMPGADGEIERTGGVGPDGSQAAMKMARATAIVRPRPTRSPREPSPSTRAREAGCEEELVEVTMLRLAS